MNLNDIVSLSGRLPEPWLEGRTIPWDDKEFSRRMLRQHLSHEHDRASRRSQVIDQHLVFLRHVALPEDGGSVVDLGCGPGLYVHKLAAAGFKCLGVDFAPASIEYAREEAARRSLDCRFDLADIRLADVGTNVDLIMLLYGELNLFPRDQAVDLLQRCGRALSPQGRVVLEGHDFELLRTKGMAGATWSALASGVFSNGPHLHLMSRSGWRNKPVPLAAIG
jgi:SAM-dependent methyltransferase